QRAAIAQGNIKMTVIIQVCSIAAHAAPALRDSKLAADFSKRAVAIVPVNARWMRVAWRFSRLHRMHHILMDRPGVLNDVEPAVIIDVTPLRAKRQVGVV